MIELRWMVLSTGIGQRHLQYRQLLSRIDASGALNVMPPEWGPWVDVPTVITEPLTASGEQK